MNIGQKIQMLKDSMMYKHFQEFGKAVGLPGDWLLELSKKEEIGMTDVSRLVTIANFFNVSLDWLLNDNIENQVEIKSGLSDKDICKMLCEVQKQAQDKNIKFNDCEMDTATSKLCIDAIEEVKRIVQENL